MNSVAERIALRPRSILPPTIGLLIFLLAAPAFGEDQDAAIRLAGEASEAFQLGEYVTAAEKFAEANDNYPDHSLKMNEMVSWYKARRCEEALVIARETTSSEKPLTERDRIDIDKVNTECGVDEAQAMFDAGDLDGAEERLGLVLTNDADLAVRIGELRGSIKERRRLAAEERDDGDEVVDELPDIEPVTPPPSWVLPTGIVLTATGIAGAVTVAIKRSNDKRNLALYDAELATSGCSVSARDCNPEMLSAELANVYDTGVRQLQAANAANVTIGVLSGVSFAAGTGMIIYHLVRSARANSAAAEQEAPEAMLVPAVGPEFTGATLHLRF